MNASTASILDVRTIVPRERHPLIFGRFAALQPGDELQLVNDHDPKPLYYQFQAEAPGSFTWDYLESGPEVWRVRIGKTQSTPAVTAPETGGCCSGGRCG